MITFNTNDFFWVGDKCKLIVDISDLSACGKGQVFCHLFPGSDDRGFTLISSKTGVTVRFVVDFVSTYDGDIEFWRLVPAHVDKHLLPPNRQNLTIAVYND